MADPVTTNKFLAQPVRGTDVGTWDTPVNGNMGIIDNSFGGTATIALTNSPVTLSSAQYQCVFLRFTGAVSANIPITLPNAGSFYTVINDTTNSSAFYLTMATTVAGGQAIGLPPGTVTEIFCDATNVKFRHLPHVGSYWDYAGSSAPAWNSACTVPPWLNCDGTAFSSATYPALASVLGGTTLPDSKGRLRLTLDQGAARVSSAVSGVAGNTIFAGGGDQSLQSHTHTASVTDPGHFHTEMANTSIGAFAIAVQSVSNANSLNTNVQTASAVTGISVTNASAGTGASQNMPPVYVGGLTFIRAA